MCWTFRTYPERARFLDRDFLASCRHRVVLIRQDCVWCFLGGDAGTAAAFLCWIYNSGETRQRWWRAYTVEEMTQRQCYDKSLLIVMQHKSATAIQALGLLCKGSFHVLQ